ncbi:DUF4236 domain-containing protein [Bacillus mangrovi]|uniref:DUF4236 domain-containing protein n=1 Tax=Metabacillus mangrovi TaxID=1491830 RepID=A0A7X2S6E6_9BACI|nr:DUF4236 domain-containing protein [Metabacillus mangrovi]
MLNKWDWVFERALKIAPGVRVYLGRKSVGISAGVQSLRHSVNSRSGSRTTAGIPRSGLSYSVQHGKGKKTVAFQRQRELAARQKEIDLQN